MMSQFRDCIHLVLKDPQTYEAFNPAEIGWGHQLVGGKHSGRHLIQNILQQNGISLNDSDLQLVLDSVRSCSTKVKRNLTADELLNLVPHNVASYGL